MLISISISSRDRSIMVIMVWWSGGLRMAMRNGGNGVMDAGRNGDWVAI